MRVSIISVLCVCIFASACAKRPNSIVPITVSSSAYSNMECTALAEELMLERQSLVAMSKAQNQAATADAIGVFLVGVPAASLMGGDNEGNIAVAKGKIVALESSQKRKSC